MRILIAEDERITHRKLQRQLEQMGHDVVATANGWEAWQQFQADPPEMVVCDWEMPEMNGWNWSNASARPTAMAMFTS